jgi:hypothetical protein
MPRLFRGGRSPKSPRPRSKGVWPTILAFSSLVPSISEDQVRCNGCNAGLGGALSAQDHIDSGEYEFQFGPRQLSHSLREFSFVERDDLGDVGDGVL